MTPNGTTPPHWETYRVEADPTDRVLDVLLGIKWEQDDTLALALLLRTASAAPTRCGSTGPTSCPAKRCLLHYRSCGGGPVPH